MSCDALTGEPILYTNICALHASSAGHPEECTRCDECHHEDIVHVEDLDNPTCWAQARCADCVASLTSEVTA